jgi:hypothetical protein
MTAIGGEACPRCRKTDEIRASQNPVAVLMELVRHGGAWIDRFTSV